MSIALIGLMAMVAPADATPPPAPTEQPAPPLPNFEFKGAIAGEQAKTNGFDPCNRSDRLGEVYCFPFGRITVSDVEVTTLSLALYQGRMTSVFGKFQSRSFDQLSAAFAEKYGKPCRTAESEWKSVSGIATANVRITWCFKTGELHIIRTGDRLGQGSFTYIDQWKMPEHAPKVDF